MTPLLILVSLLLPVTPNPTHHDIQEPPCASPSCHKGYTPETPPPSHEKE